jgi:hypothetical protein
VRDGRCNACPPGEIRMPNGQCCDRREVRDGRCKACPPDEIRLPNGQCCDRREVRDGRCNACPPGEIRLPNGQCCPPGNVHDGKCVEILREIRHPIRRLKVDEPREPVRHGTTFHTRIPTGVIIQGPRTPSLPSRGKGTISTPHSNGGNSSGGKLMLR